MSELKKNFVQGKMNKDYDVRLIPEGEYIDAFNVLVSNSEGSQVGSIQNSYGLDKISDLNIPFDSESIGSVSDEGNEKIYWFVTSSTSNYIFEYDQLNSVTGGPLVSTILQDSRTSPNNVLNFNKQYKITGANVIYNSFNKETLLVWTDDLNPIRCINVDRAKGYGPSTDVNTTFLSKDISLYKRQPHFAPICTPTTTGNGTENNIKERFLSFGYRWKYLDGEYSAISTFSNPQFYPGQYSLDYLTHENIGMVNKFNAVNIGFNTGDKNVTDVQLVFKESNSNNIWIIDTFNKTKLFWTDNSDRSFLFSNNKIYSVLPEDEVNRLFDNVPVLSKAQDFIGNRLIYGNYVEGHDMVDTNGQPIKIDYTLSPISEDKTNDRLTTDIITHSEIIDGVSTPVADSLRINFAGKQIKAGDLLNFNFRAKSAPISYHGNYNCSISMFLGADYTNAEALRGSGEFQNFINVIAYNNFKYYDTGSQAPANEVVDYVGKYKPFEILSGTTPDVIEIKLPYIEYQVDNTPSVHTDSDFTLKQEYFYYVDGTINISLSNGNAYSSCKSNRSYEAGIVYLDDEGRYSTVITNSHSNSTNNCFIPVLNSVNKNSLQMQVHHKAPYWATKYKVFVKDNKLEYQTIYALVVYKKDNYIWIKLEGQEKNKVQDGDILILKRNLYGPTVSLIKVQVLEYKQQAENFITGAPAGNYIKVKSFSGIDIASLPNNYLAYENHVSNSDCGAHGFLTYTGPFGTLNPSTGLWEDTKITAGSILYFKLSNGRTNTEPNPTFEKTYISSADYNSIYEWWITEMNDETGFDIVWTRGHYVSIGGGFFSSSHFVADNNYPYSIGFWNLIGSTGGETQFNPGHPSYSDSKITITLATSVIILETDPKDKSSEVYYEIPDTYLIDSNGNHLSKKTDSNYPVDADVDQDGITTAATLNLSFFNCYSQGNGAESYRVKDLFNSNYLSTNTRPNAVQLDGYKERRNIASLTYSGGFEKTTNYNSLNEFNLSRANYKDLDDKYGRIQKLFSRDTDLIVFQEDKLHKVLYNKNLLSDAVGGGQITSVEQVLGQEIPYAGEFGIGTNPETFSNYANNIYFTDQPKGVVLRLGSDGLEPISRYGMKDWFRDNLRDYSSKFIVGGYDPSYDNYILGFTNENKQVKSLRVNCNQQINNLKLTPSNSLYYDINIGNKVGDFVFNYQITEGVLDATITIGVRNYANPGLTESGSVIISRTGTEETAYVLINNTHEVDAMISFSNHCPITNQLEVVTLVVNDISDAGKSMTNKYSWVDSMYGYSGNSTDVDTFTTSGLTRFRTEVGIEADGPIPFEGSLVRVSSIKGNGVFTGCNKIGYTIASSDYDAQQIIDNATYPSITTVGDENYIEFTFERLGDLSKKLYIVWDYIDDVYAANTNILKSINQGTSFSLNSLDNITHGTPYTLSMITGPEYGGFEIVGDYITYVHNGSSLIPDFYIYRVSSGECSVDIRVDILINEPLDCRAYQFDWIDGPLHSDGLVRYLDCDYILREMILNSTTSTEQVCLSSIVSVDRVVTTDIGACNQSTCRQYKIYSSVGVNTCEYIDCFGDYQTATADGTEGYVETLFCASTLIGLPLNVVKDGNCTI